MSEAIAVEIVLDVTCFLVLLIGALGLFLHNPGESWDL